MALPKQVLDQLKNTTCDKLIRALMKDGFTEESGRGATRAFHKGGRRVVVHYHPRKTYGLKLMSALLEDIGWSVEDLERLKLIKRRRRK